MLLLLVPNAYALTFSESVDFPDSSSFGFGSVSVGLLDVGANTDAGSRQTPKCSCNARNAARVTSVASGEYATVLQLDRGCIALIAVGGSAY